MLDLEAQIAAPGVAGLEGAARRHLAPAGAPRTARLWPFRSGPCWQALSPAIHFGTKRQLIGRKQQDRNRALW
jgi:hypothetical protein